MARLERDYQARLIKDLKDEFPGAVILKNDTSYLQGILDLSMFYEDKYAILEVKRSAKDALPENLRPNQGYYVELFDRMSYANFVHPENEEEVFRDLQRTFRPRRHSRVPKR